MMLLFLACVDPIHTPSPADSTVEDSTLVDDTSTADSGGDTDDKDTDDKDTDEEDTGGDDTGGQDTDEDPPDYSQPGPVNFTTSDASITTGTGCSLSYVHYSPDQPVGHVVLAHGFLRSSDQMTGWAEHLASWGLEVSVPDLCWSGFTPDPAKNALDIAELADGPVALVGHSAGGLAVTLAAANMSVTAVVGLDPVEQFGQDNSSTAASINAPALALFGAPGSCNSENSGETFFGAVPGGRMMNLTGADHCDFENPTDFACEAFCTANDAGFTDDQRRDALAGVVTSFVLGQHVDGHIDAALDVGVLSDR